MARRATWGKLASPALVVRRPMRVVAAGASRLQPVCASDLRLTDVTAWGRLHQTLDYRQEAVVPSCVFVAIRMPISLRWGSVSSLQVCHPSKKHAMEEF